MQLTRRFNRQFDEQESPAVEQSRLLPSWLEGGLVLLAVISIFTLIQFTFPGLAGNDGYYHIKMGYLIRQEGLKPVFDVLPLTILNAETFYDHHLLYHLFLALFAAVDPAVDGGQSLTTGAKIASVILPSLTFLAVWWLLRTQRVPFAALWAIGLFAASEAFLYRMSMPRAQSGSLLLLVVAVQLLLSGRYKWLAPLGFVFVWYYNAFPLLLGVAGLYAGAVLLLDRRLVWQAVAYPVLGVAAGLIINPYFPQNLAFIFDHLAPKVGDSTVPVGNEWSPYRTWTLVENSGLALLFPIVGTLLLFMRPERIDRRTLFAFLMVLAFGSMLLHSRRFVEYYPAFALIFLAFSAAPAITRLQAQLTDRHRLLAALAMAGLLLVLMFPLVRSVTDAQELLADSKPADQYQAAALWLGREAAPGDMIFQTDWDDFTRLFFYNDKVRYLAGLDPTFLQLQNEALYEEWVSITQGDVDQPGAAIRDTFDASFVFSDLRHGDFLDQAATDPVLTEVYRDDYAVVFRVNRP